MKKIYSIFVVCLLLGLITYNAALNIIAYDLNYYFYYFYDVLAEFENEVVAGILYVVPYVLIGGIISILFSWIFKIFTKKEVINLQQQEEINKLKKTRKILFVINFIAYSICAIISLINLELYNIEASDVIQNWYETYKNDEMFVYWFSTLSRPYSNVITGIFCILIHLLSSIPIIRNLKVKDETSEEVVKKSKILKVIGKSVIGVSLLLMLLSAITNYMNYFNGDGLIISIIFLIVEVIIIMLLICLLPIKKNWKQKIKNVLSISVLLIFVVLVLGINLYNYMDIPEFNYVYYFSDSKVICCEYSDIRKILKKEDYIVPEKLWGKEVAHVHLYNGLALWLYPETKIILPNTLSWEKLIGENEEEKFFVENLLLTMGNEIAVDGEPIEWFIEDNDIYNIEKTGVILLNSNSGDINIPATVKNIYSNILAMNKSVNVDKNNEYYFSYDGVLYTKEKFWEEPVRCWTSSSDSIQYKEDRIQVCMVPITKEEVILPNNIIGEKLAFFAVNLSKIIIPKDFNKDVHFLLPVDDIIFEVEDGNQYYCIENNYLYSKEKTKLVYAPLYNWNSTIFIEPFVKEIDEELLKENGDRFEVSPDNPFIERIEDGKIIYK